MVARHHGACCWRTGGVRSAVLPKWFTRSWRMLRGGVEMRGAGSRRLVTFGLQNVTANVTNVIFFVTRSDFGSGFGSDFRSGFWGTLYTGLSNAAHGPSTGSDTSSRLFPYSSRTSSWRRTWRVSVRSMVWRRLHLLYSDRTGGQGWSRHAGYGRGSWPGQERRIFPRGSSRCPGPPPGRPS